MHFGLQRFCLRILLSFETLRAFSIIAVSRIVDGVTYGCVELAVTCPFQ